MRNIHQQRYVHSHSLSLSLLGGVETLGLSLSGSANIIAVDNIKCLYCNSSLSKCLYMYELLLFHLLFNFRCDHRLCCALVFVFVPRSVLCLSRPSRFFTIIWKSFFAKYVSSSICSASDLVLSSCNMPRLYLHLPSKLYGLQQYRR